jgi:3-deoxy-D-manno-oct-2-ulosonic acid (Kdo) hydroxylase
MFMTPPDAALELTADALEREDLLFLPKCPFALPPLGQVDFLRRQEAVAFGHKDLSFDPHRGRLTGLRAPHPAEAKRLADILTQFSVQATEWVKHVFPKYAPGLVRDRVMLRTSEEATRTLRLTARNDLFHVDNFATRPTNGRRILRVSVNINPTDPQVWATSERFPQLLAMFAAQSRVPARSVAEWTAPARQVVRLFAGGRARKSAYDAWMLKLHHFLKENNQFQATAKRRVWTFPSGSAWVLFADGVAHAQLRGRFTLEHSFFVPVQRLERPDESPLALLVQSAAAKRRAG